MLQLTDYNVTLVSRSVFTITWNQEFTSLHGVTHYRISSADSSTAICPPRCLPSEPCQCTPPAVGEPVSMSISATNCGDQEGQTNNNILQAEARVPSQPLGCLGVPAYNYTSDLIGIKLQWMRVDVSCIVYMRLILILCNRCCHCFVHPRTHLSSPWEHNKTSLSIQLL